MNAIHVQTVSVQRIVRLLDHCEAVLRAIQKNPIPSTDIRICALQRANECAAMQRELKQPNAKLTDSRPAATVERKEKHETTQD